MKTKLNSFPIITNKELQRLYDLSDVLEEILSLKRDKRYDPLFTYYDASLEMIPYLFAKKDRDWLITVNRLLIEQSNSLHVL